MRPDARHRRWVLGLAALSVISCGAPVASSAAAMVVKHPLQPLIDAAEVGARVMVPAGEWSGPLHIDKALTLDGQGAATITGNGHGTVITVSADGVTVRGLRITGSGESHDQMDAAILVTGNGNRVEHNVLDDVLFGVFVQAGSANVVCANVITSKREEHSLRGDAVRVWNGRHNQIVGNDVTLARDVSLANSGQNTLSGNRIRQGRYGMQLVFSPRNAIVHNLLDENLTGIAVLYSNDVTIQGNTVMNSRGASGTGLTFKESGQCIVEDNDIVHCSVGAKTNAPTSPEAIISFHRNRFAHNIAGMDFYGENGGHIVHENRFEKNLVQVTVSAPMSARGQDWADNYWDDYEGFDQDGDGIGDVPYEVYSFADRIWQETPQATFFRNAPAMELLDFLERLAPFASPQLTLSDPRPRSRPAADPPALGVHDFTLSCP